MFSARIMKLHQYLIKNKKETIIYRQIVRSGTSIGANINEANYGQSKADFISKMYIALKEMAETEYWLGLLFYRSDDEGCFVVGLQWKSNACTSFYQCSKRK